MSTRYNVLFQDWYSVELKMAEVTKMLGGANVDYATGDSEWLMNVTRSRYAMVASIAAVLRDDLRDDKTKRTREDRRRDIIEANVLLDIAWQMHMPSHECGRYSDRIISAELLPTHRHTGAAYSRLGSGAAESKRSEDAEDSDRRCHHEINELRRIANLT